MENKEFIKRMEDLADRCDRTCTVTSTGFLTPAEQYQLRGLALGDCRLVLSGGGDGCERQVAFFIPYYMEESDLDVGEYIRGVRVRAYFGQPTHRDYMGAALGLGIGREWLGDIRLVEDGAYLFCLPSVERLLVEELDKVGRVGVRASSCALADIPPLERKVKKVSFTVKSLRLDAVVGSMFGLSRTAAAELIRMGAATINYEPCLHTDAPVKEGDVISLRGHGKGMLTQEGGRSRKDRQFLEAEIYV
jgi:RNA-binding protein YlmH